MDILRKSLVMLAFALVSISAMAEQFCYLTFETKDGTKASGQDLVKGGSWDSSVMPAAASIAMMHVMVRADMPM